MFDKIKEALENYSAAQTVAERFTVSPDRMREVPNDDTVAKVFLYLGSINPEGQTVHGYTQVKVQYYVDMLVRKKASLSEGVQTAAHAAAGIRLRYLIAQVMEALYPSGSRLLGMTAGSIATKEFNVNPMMPDEVGEPGLAAARLTLTVGLPWEPSEVTGTDLAAINVTADKWSALIEP
jgi:hypothetical protein